MPTFRIQLLAGVALLGAAATASAITMDPVFSTPALGLSKPAAVQDEGASQSGAEACEPKERLQIGLSDSDTKLALPWFVTELKDAVNEDRSLEDTAKGLARGL